MQLEEQFGTTITLRNYEQGGISVDSQSDGTVAILGAGPFGVSLAAHLRSSGVDFRIFGKPMHRWRRQMPNGMFLKSEGMASNLSSPDRTHTLARYCAGHGLPYGDWGVPVSVDVFLKYALAFQRELVAEVEEVYVTRVDTSGRGFELNLENGTTVHAGKVVVATGLEHAAQVPPVLAQLPQELVSHTSDHEDLSRFRDKDVTVVGGGQSALETATLLAEQGASVTVIVRKPSLTWNSFPQDVPRAVYWRLRHPRSGLGEGLQLWAYATAPMLFRYLPLDVRLKKVKSTLGPAGAWWLKERADGRLQVLVGHSVRTARTQHGRALLHVAGPDGCVVDIATDHVIAGTGYRFDVHRLPFLAQSIGARIRTENQMPVLSSGFESSIPHLYFTGLASANAFGPVMRFLVGAEYTARAITRHIADARRWNRLNPVAWEPGVPKCRES
jgi:thioredoxin reductase